VRGGLPLSTALLVTPLAGIAGGITGGLFSRCLLFAMRPGTSPLHRLRAWPVVFAGLCGFTVAAMGWLSGGTSWGTGYAATKLLVEGAAQPGWVIVTRSIGTLATAISGTPGGIFAPSLAIGAELGNIVAWAFPHAAPGPIVLLGMTAYFTGVVRAPLTAVIIVSEATASHALTIPLFAAALIADGTSALVCREKLYHGLSRGFRQAPRAAPPAPAPAPQ
jgi:H+/Cl- antiporter ClcA